MKGCGDAMTQEWREVGTQLTPLSCPCPCPHHLITAPLQNRGRGWFKGQFPAPQSLSWGAACAAPGSVPIRAWLCRGVPVAWRG